MDDLIAEIKRLLEEDDPTITVQEFIPRLNDEYSTLDADEESSCCGGVRSAYPTERAGILHSELHIQVSFV